MQKKQPPELPGSPRVSLLSPGGLLLVVSWVVSCCCPGDCGDAGGLFVSGRRGRRWFLNVCVIYADRIL